MLGKLGLLAAALAMATPVAALDLAPREIHLRAGLSLKPDQFLVGTQATLGPPHRLSWRPSLDLGLGNGVRMLTLNADVVWRLRQAGRRLEPFAGAGPALSLVDVTDGVGEADGITAGLAGHVVAGIHLLPARRRGGLRYLVEVRAGIGETADFKLVLALAF